MMGVITVKLNPTNVFTRWPCFFCGGCSEKDSVLADVLEDGKGTGTVVCPRCLADPDLRTTIRARALQFREEAVELDTLAEHIPALPTMAEWRDAMIAATAEWRAPDNPRSRQDDLGYRLALFDLPFDYVMTDADQAEYEALKRELAELDTANPPDPPKEFKGDLDRF